MLQQSGSNNTLCKQINMHQRSKKHSKYDKIVLIPVCVLYASITVVVFVQNGEKAAGVRSSYKNQRQEARK
jgi:hypothetical protein